MNTDRPLDAGQWLRGIRAVTEMTEFDYGRAGTNGDRVAPYVAAAKTAAARMLAQAREHPDEAAVAVAPWALLTLATARHNLNIFEALILADVSVYGGLLAVRAYRQWKNRPAGPIGEG